MADARFSGLYMVIPCLGVVMLFVFIMQFLIRLWMINSPKYVRKSVRFPLNEDLTDHIMNTLYRADPPNPAKRHAYVRQGYRPRSPPPEYRGKVPMPQQPAGQYAQQPAGQYPRQPAGQYPRQPAGQYPTQPAGQYPTQPMAQYPPQASGGYPREPRYIPQGINI